MSIFDSFFGIKRNYKMPEIPDTRVGEAVAEAQKKEEEKPKLPAYQVGLTADNRVTLKIGSSYYDSTLTMTPEGVRHLIRVLEAAIPEYVVADSVEETESEEA